MTDPSLITIVTPVYCEEESLERFYEEVSATINGCNFETELLFVDDGSTDRTPEILQQLRQKDPRVKIITLSRNFGSLAAFNAGLTHAAGDAAMILSADLQEPPELILKFVEKWREGNHIVWAVRESRDDPWLKSLFANIFYWLMRHMAFPDFPRGGMDTGLFDRRIINIYCTIPEKLTSPFFTIYSLGFKQCQIPYHRRRREQGTSKWPFLKRVRNAIDIIVSFTAAPVHFMAVVGLLLSGLAIFGALIIIYQRVFLGMGESGWPSLAVLVLFTSGLNLMLLGVAAEYIYRIAQEVKKQPRYLIMTTDGIQEEGPRTDPEKAEVSSQARKES
jgi:glycosyltransferase involved in cell wall biosynthesis